MGAMESTLAGIVGKHNISTHDYERWCYSRDFSPEFPQIPSVVVTPEDTAQVSEIVKFANQTKTPVWPRGGGTSCCAAAMPLQEGGILLDLTRLNKIIQIDEESMTATVQASVVLRTLEEELKKKNLHPLNLGSCGSGLAATVGGGIATAAGGWGSALSGSYCEQVVCLEVVLPTGQVLRTGSDSIKNGTTCERYVNGPDLAGLFCGSQGFLGIITEATVRLIPAPEKVDFSTPTFSTLEKLSKVLMEITRNRIAYGALALAGKRTVKGMFNEEMENEGVVFAIIQGREDEVERKKQFLDQIITKYDGMDLGGEITKAGLYDEDLFWHVAAALKFGHYAAGCNMLPLNRLPSFVQRAEQFFHEDNKALTEESGVTGPFIFPAAYIGRAPMVNVIYYDETDPKRWKLAVELWKKWLDSNLANGGGAYWIGSAYGNLLSSHWNESTYSLMKTLKGAMDPNNILNPGLFGDV